MNRAASLPATTSLVDDGDYGGEITQLRVRSSALFRIGYWCGASGTDAWRSVVAGVLPDPALRLTQEAQNGDVAEVACLEASFAPM